MAFSLLSGRQLFLIVATSAALILVAYWLLFRSRSNRLQQAALILVLGGGIGNLIDRVLNGEVVGLGSTNFSNTWLTTGT